MAWRKQPESVEIPDWIRHEEDGGFVASDWMTPEDFESEPRVAEWHAKARWMAERNAWLCDHPDVFEVLLEQLRQLCVDDG